MANQPVQYPNIDLPGAEYFSLAPNRTIALQGRRRRAFVSATVTAPATTNNTNVTTTTLLESGFTQTSGIYLHFFYITIGPLLPGLTLNNAFAGLTLQSPTLNPDYPLGNPTLTSPNIEISTVLLNDRDRMISAKDILAPTPGSNPISQNLSLVTQVNVNNPTSGAIQLFTIQNIIYTRLDGLTE